MDKKPGLFKNTSPKFDSRFRDIFEYSLEAVSRIDKQGNYLSVNERYAKTFGYQNDEIVGLSWYETIHSDDLDKARSAYELMVEEGKADIELRGIKKDGTFFFKHILLVKAISEEASLLGHYCFMQDITERKLSEHSKHLNLVEELTQKEELFNTLVDAFNIRQGICFFNDLSKYIQKTLKADYVIIGEIVNDNVLEMRSLSVLHNGKFLEQICYSLSGTPCENVFSQTNYSCPANVREVFPDFDLLKTLSAESYVGSALLDYKGIPIGIVSVINTMPITNIDTSESVINLFAIRAADELNRRNREANLNLYKNMIDSSADFISMVDRNYNYVSINKTYEKFFNKEKEEIIGHSLLEFHGDDDFTGIVKPDLDKCFKGEIVNSRIVKFKDDGSELYLNTIYNPHYSVTGEIIGAVIVSRDMTDYFAAENELDRSREYIEKVIKLSPDMICVTSFEDGEVVDVNESFCKGTGWSRVEVIGKTSTELGFYSPKIRKKYVDMIINDGEINGEELVFYKKNGEMVYTLASSFLIELYGKKRILSIARDITERKQSEILHELESICYRIDSNSIGFNETIEQIIKEVESRFKTLIGSVSLLDNEKIHLLRPVAPSLPKEYLDKIENIEIGEGVGSCGTAAYREELVVVDDIENSELWKNYTRIADEFGLKACWSFPVKSSNQQVQGTFAGYYKKKQKPSGFELMLLERIARVIGDIVEQYKNGEKLRESREKFRTLYDDTPSMFFSLDKEGAIISVNQFGAIALGYEVKDLLGTNVLNLIHDLDKHKALEKFTECFANPGATYRWEIRKKHRDGHAMWVRETAHVVATANKSEIFIVCEDISENYRLSQQLEYQATHDALTGLVNRREFEKRLERMLNVKSIQIPGHAICYLDLDNFKIINDTCGHLAGDAMLRQLSQLLSTTVRTRDTLARLGGDEFGILMEHCSLNKATKVAEKVLSAVEEFRFVWDDNKFVAGVSIGLVPINETSGNVADVLSAADNACYIAKDAGRNRIHVFSPDDAELEKRRGEMQWVARINQALEEDMFRLFYQEVVPATPGKIIIKKRFELLVRIKTYDGNYILPGAFLPAAERYNLSTKIDQWVIDAALSWLSSDLKIMNSVESCAINLSGHSISNEYFLDYCIEKISSSKISPRKLCFEITETAAIANLASARKFMSELKEKGCSFALDDFGSGLSSFAYLKNLPVDYLKIDGAFIRDLLIDPVDYEMVSAINRLGHVMDKLTIAEFVENNEILHMLHEIGVDYAQGYAIGKPKPIELFLSNLD